MVTRKEFSRLFYWLRKRHASYTRVKVQNVQMNRTNVISFRDHRRRMESMLLRNEVDKKLFGFLNPYRRVRALVDVPDLWEYVSARVSDSPTGIFEFTTPIELWMPCGIRAPHPGSSVAVFRQFFGLRAHTPLRAGTMIRPPLKYISIPLQGAKHWAMLLRREGKKKMKFDLKASFVDQNWNWIQVANAYRCFSLSKIGKFTMCYCHYQDLRLEAYVNCGINFSFGDLGVCYANCFGLRKLSDDALMLLRAKTYSKYLQNVNKFGSDARRPDADEYIRLIPVKWLARAGISREIIESLPKRPRL